ncbi:MAG: formylmethanofuran dehydrogenase subunit E family protein [Thermoplasmata archaeon]|nr:formylmethanofuran dehydrogenase subunit E family protein [Thermoplasmata archaeon]
MNSEETLKRISEFHGHLGPFVVVGYRMGVMANRLLGADPFGKTALALTGGKPPKSCLIDGIQLSSGCTLGKGLIGVVDQGEVAAVFMSKGRKATYWISLKNAIAEQIAAASHKELEPLAVGLYSLAEDELFDVYHEE